MNEPFTVIVSEPHVDGLAAAALVARACPGRFETLVCAASDLLAFFGPGVQRKLPRTYDLVLCGLEVVHVDWDGRPVRPGLMDALRGFLGPITWCSARAWEPEDVRAVAHTIGEANLNTGSAASSAAAVADRTESARDAFGRSLVQFAEDRLAEADEQRWGRDLRLVLTALNGDYDELAGTVRLMAEERISELISQHRAAARRVHDEVRAFAHEHAADARTMGETRVVALELPADFHPFWEEAGRYAREAAEAQVSVCLLTGRPVAVIARDAGEGADLRAWARYVTDLMPSARTVGAQPEMVPLVVPGLREDHAVLHEVLDLMADGAHLLRR